jgi:hypothetical protein
MHRMVGVFCFRVVATVAFQNLWGWIETARQDNLIVSLEPYQTRNRSGTRETGGTTMTKQHILVVPALVLVMLASDALAQRRGGAVSGGVRGAMVGGLVGGSEGAQTGARVGAVTGATRAAVDREAQRRATYQTTAEYQSAPRSDFNTAPPQVLATTAPGATAPPAATAPSAASTTSSAEAVIRKNGQPMLGITYPADWKRTIGDRYVSAVSADGQAYSMIATVEGAADKQAGLAQVKQGLERYLQDITYDDPTETKRGALAITGTGKGKKAGVPVVFAAGVFETAPRQIAGVAFVVDSRIEDHYKETVQQICQTIRVGDQIADKN